jgi:putative phosphoesterase
MRVAALYDIHGMPWALEAVLADLGDVDAIVVGGDVLGGPYDDETVELVRSLDAVVIRGNAENEDPWGKTLPLTVELDGVLYCHATPTDNTPITTAITPDDALVDVFGSAGTFVIGHTHTQFERRVGGLRVLNAGSVGMPYEGEVAAFWLVMSDGEPEFRKTRFDVSHAVERVRASDWPSAAEFAEENLLAAVGREEAIRHFESQR